MICSETAVAIEGLVATLRMTLAGLPCCIWRQVSRFIDQRVALILIELRHCSLLLRLSFHLPVESADLHPRTSHLLL